MIVVDMNVIGYLLIRGKRSEEMDRLLLAEPDWIAPRLWARRVCECALHI